MCDARWPCKGQRDDEGWNRSQRVSSGCPCRLMDRLVELFMAFGKFLSRKEAVIPIGVKGAAS